MLTILKVVLSTSELSQKEMVQFSILIKDCKLHQSIHNFFLRNLSNVRLDLLGEKFINKVLVTELAEQLCMYAKNVTILSAIQTIRTRLQV